MTRSRTFAGWILKAEPLVITIIGFAFWYPAPPRDQWMWLLAFLLPIIGARWIIHGRLWTRTPLDGWLLIFLLLAIRNMDTAPYTRNWIVLSRPLFGIALYYSGVEYPRERGDLDRLLRVTTWLALLIGILSITATQWNDKSESLRFLLNALPTIQGFPGAESGFNANEIAGAIAWLQPLTAAIAWRYWSARRPYLGALLAFTCLSLGLFFGQSRPALLGVGLALGLLALVLIQRRVWRALALIALAAVALLEFGIISSGQEPSSANSLSPRDEQSLIGRQDIWLSALHIVRDYPWTGVGMSMFRDGRVRERYPAPGYNGAVLPHTHNEWLQIAADLGLPGLAIFIGWQATIIYMLLYVWKHGDGQQRILTAGLAGGLLAHAVFGLADAITLWDRFTFIFWWLLALVGGQYSALKYRH